jgi:hypothetical protein
MKPAEVLVELRHTERVLTTEMDRIRRLIIRLELSTATPAELSVNGAQQKPREFRRLNRNAVDQIKDLLKSRPHLSIEDIIERLPYRQGRTRKIVYHDPVKVQAVVDEIKGGGDGTGSLPL